MRTIELLWDEQMGSNYFIREAFNTLRANILFSGKNVKVIIVTSCRANEGKTSISFDLCRNLAESGKKVLLVDADLRKSVMVGRYTKERGVYGLSQVLSGQVEAQNAIYHTNVERLDIVFSGPYPPNPTELAGSPAFKEFVDEVRPQYDYVIIDAPPLGLVIDAAVMSGVCDGAVMVISIGHVKHRIAQDVKAQLEKSGCKVLGVILNQVDRKRSIKGDQSYYSSYMTDRPVQRQTGAAPLNTAAQRPTQPAQPAARPQTAQPTVRPQPSPAQRPQGTVAPTDAARRPVPPSASAQPRSPQASQAPRRPYGTVPPTIKKDDQ